MKRGKVFVDDLFAGVIAEADGSFTFTYTPDYLDTKDAKAVSLTLPLQAEPYEEKTMIPFFDGLIPEGWLLDIVITHWKINRRDRMSLLLLACHDCIGNVSVRAENSNE